MASLEEIAIEHIEKTSGTELPQDEKRIIREIVSKHEFDEGNTITLGEIYKSTRDLPPRIWSGFCLVLNLTLEENEKLLGNEQLSRLLQFFNNITDFYRTRKPIERLDILPYTNNLMELLCETHRRENSTTLSKYLEILDKLFQLDRNFLFSNHQPGNYSSFISALFYPYKIEKENDIDITIYLHNINTITNFLDSLLKYKVFDNKPVPVPEFLEACIHNSLNEDELFLNRLSQGTQFLTHHNPEKESLSEIIDKLVECMKLDIQDYEIVDFLGEGAYKKTYLARDRHLNHYVALKIIDVKALAQQPNIRRLIKTKMSTRLSDLTKEALNKMNQKESELTQEQLDQIHNIEDMLIPTDFRIITQTLVTIFQEEAKLMLKATQTRSNHIPIIYRAYYDPKRNLYIIAEELADQTLNHLICNNKIKTIEQIVYLIKNIVRGVEDLHKLGFAHGDIKPDNILINTDGKIRITDFGWSSQIPLLSEHYDDPRYLTNLLTCAPEIFDGKHPDQKSDMWSIGIIAYKMMTGKWPFHHGFTGSEEEWRKLPLEEKQKYARRIREQMTEERIREINQSISEQIKEITSRPKYYGDHNDLNFISKFINQSLQIQYENRKMHDGGPLIRFERPIPKHTSGLYGD